MHQRHRVAHRGVDNFGYNYGGHPASRISLALAISVATNRVKKKSKTCDRLVPIFDGRVQWKGGKGFASMLLILSCLGAEGELLTGQHLKKSHKRHDWELVKISSYDTQNLV